eukprot:scaffold261_cov336-Pavlova_lutheri.AAC.62
MCVKSFTRPGGSPSCSDVPCRCCHARHQAQGHWRSCTDRSRPSGVYEGRSSSILPVKASLVRVRRMETSW